MPGIEDIAEWAKRRGVFYPSCEIYGGLSGIYDYGPVGARMKRGFEDAWRNYFLSLNPNYHEIEPSVIMLEKVFEASGHLRNFTDPVAKCRKCGAIQRADHLIEDATGRDAEGMGPEEMSKAISESGIRCPECGGEFGPVRKFSLMFGFGFGSGETAYLRPETAQGPYLNFLRSFQVLRKKLPLGLVVVGRAFRNEISPRQLTMRQREFTQAELQIFIHPGMLEKSDIWERIRDEKVPLQFSDRRDREFEMTTLEDSGLPQLYAEYLYHIWRFYTNVMGLPEGTIRFRELSGAEKAFYNKYHWDIQYRFSSLGWKEIGGLHYRTDHDLTGHQRVSGKSHEVFWDGEKFVPHVLEVSFGVDRNLLALIDNGWTEGERFVMRLPPQVSPYVAAVFPLVNKDGLLEISLDVFRSLYAKFPGRVFFDKSGSIGRRYARQDEIGTYYCVTIDHQTKEDNTVTVRFRDTAEQIRVAIDDLEGFLKGNR